MWVVAQLVERHLWRGAGLEHAARGPQRNGVLRLSSHFKELLRTTASRKAWIQRLAPKRSKRDEKLAGESECAGLLCGFRFEIEWAPGIGGLRKRRNFQMP